MTYSPFLVHLTGLGMMGFSFLLSTTTYIASILCGSEPTLISAILIKPVTPEFLGLPPSLILAIGTAVAGVATVVVNGYVNNRKNRYDLDGKIAESEDRIATRVADALRIKDAEVAKVLQAKDAENEASARKLQDESLSARVSREAERQFQNAAFLKLQQELNDLRAGGNKAAVRAEAVRIGMNTNVDAINALADATNVRIAVSGKIPAAIQEIPNSKSIPVQINPSLPTVLILDDTIATVDAVTHLLRSIGWDITVASNGVQGITYATSTLINFDVLACGLKMPDVSGVEVIRLFRQSHKTSPKTGQPIRIIAYTCCDRLDPLVAQAIEVGADAVLFKPCDLEVLIATLKGEFAGDVPIPAPGAVAPG